ncbi:MAG: metalloregulator ArsR/SmtB family transcription factor [Spirochaetaceae bacterium]|nr:metalloregulator ArsR/SmtB family transcription factor [Spirochaetaceae bacterium]
MCTEETLYELAELFKTLGDSTRIRITAALLKEELCVCDIAAVLGMSVSAVSHQLRILKQAKLVRFRREGKTIYYSLDDDHVSVLFDTGLVHVGELNRGGM